MYVYPYRNGSKQQPDREPDLGQSKVNALDFDNYIKKSLAEGFLVNQFNALDNNNNCTEYYSVSEPETQADKINNWIAMKPMINVETSDCLRISYINGWDRSTTYIITEGIDSLTVPEFWKTVWQNDVKTIVVATNLHENMKRQCAEFQMYSDADLPFGDVRVKLLDRQICEYFEKRVFKICFKEHHKLVSHYYLNWQLHHLERTWYPDCLVPLVQIMNKNCKDVDASSVLIHSNLCTGRSTFLILCDMGLKMAKTVGYVDIYELAKTLMKQMPNISSSQEYILAHLVISECLMEENAIFPLACSEPITVYINNQLERLDRLTWHDCIAHNLSGYDKHSANVVNSDQEYMTTRYYYGKQPTTDESAERFWNTVLNERIKIVLFLNDYKLFSPWPFTLKLSNRNRYTVHEMASNRDENCIVSRILIKEVSNTMVSADILFIQLLDWTSEVTDVRKLPQTNKLMGLIEDIRNLIPTPEKILVCCLDGISDCGLFIALSFITRKSLEEFEYDMPNAIRRLRRKNPAFLTKPNELRFLYKAISMYSREFDPNIDTYTSTSMNKP